MKSISIESIESTLLRHLLQGDSEFIIAGYVQSVEPLELVQWSAKPVPLQ